MSKSSAATAPRPSAQRASKSAWAKGPPLRPSTASNPSRRSASPPLDQGPPQPTHSRQPSALGRGVSFEDGARSPTNTVNPANTVTFGSMNDVPAPITVQTVSSFGTVATTPTSAPNGKSAGSSSHPPTSATTRPKFDVKQLFANPSSAPPVSSAPPQASDGASPLSCPSPLPPHAQTQPGQMSTHQPYHFFPRNGLRAQNGGPPPAGAPRFPVYPRQMPNGQMNGVNGRPNGAPAPTPVSAGMSSPRLGPPHGGQPPAGVPQTPQPVPPQQWYGGGYYYAPYAGMPPPEHYMSYSPWMQPQMVGTPHQQPRGLPGPPQPGIPMSPRNPPPQLHPPGTPTMTSALPSAGHPPHPAPSPHTHTSSLSSMSSPPPTPSSTGPNRLNTYAPSFHPRTTMSKVKITSSDGKEVQLDSLKKGNVPILPSAVPASPIRKTQVRLEKPEDKGKRLAKLQRERAKKEKEEEETAHKEAEKAKEKSQDNCKGVLRRSLASPEIPRKQHSGPPDLSRNQPISGRADCRPAMDPSHVCTWLDSNTVRGVKTEASPATSMSPRPVSSASTPNRSAEKCVPSPTTTAPSLSPSSRCSPSPSLAPYPSVSLGSFGGLDISGPSSMGICASPFLSASEQPASYSPEISPSSSLLDPLSTAAPVVHLSSEKVSAPAGLQEDNVQNLRILLKDISTDTLDRVVTEITAVAKDQGGSLTEILSLIIDAAIEEPFSSDMYALLCHMMIEQDEADFGCIGKLASRRVFRAQVLKQCQERLEHEWPHEDNAATPDTDISLGQFIPYSGDDAAHHDTDREAKRRALNLIKFISELLTSQVLTERIMYDSIERLLPDVGIPLDEEIECLCDVLTNVGYLLDTPDASAHMHDYFARMAGLAQSPHINLRMQVMLQNVIDSHGRSGISPQEPVYKPSFPASQNIAGSDVETENHSRTIQTTIHGESPAGGNHDSDDHLRDGDALFSEPSRPVCARPATNPSQDRRGGIMMQSTDPAYSKPVATEAPSISSSSSIMSPSTSLRPQFNNDSSPATSRRQSLGVDAIGDEILDDMERSPQYSALAILDLPSQVALAPDAIDSHGNNSKKAGDVCQRLIREEPKIHLDAEVKKLFVLRDLDKGAAYLRQLPSQHHWRWVNLLVASAIASNSIPDVRLVGDLFYRVVSKELIMPDAFVTGFTPSLDTLRIVSSNMPNAASLVAIMLKAAQLDSERLAGVVHQVEGSDLDMLVGLLL